MTILYRFIRGPSACPPVALTIKQMLDLPPDGAFNCWLRLHWPMRLRAMKLAPTTTNMKPKNRAKAGLAMKDAE